MPRPVVHFEMPEDYNMTLCKRRMTRRYRTAADPNNVTCPLCRKKLIRMGMVTGSIDDDNPSWEVMADNFLFRIGIV